MRDAPRLENALSLRATSRYNNAVMTSFLPSTSMALFAALALVSGSVLPILPRFRARVSQKMLSLLIGFSAGLMLATAIHHLIPESLHMNEDRAFWGVGFGFLALYVVERLTHFHACRHLECDVTEDVDTSGQWSVVGGRDKDAHHEHAHNDSCEHSHATSSTRSSTSPVHSVTHAPAHSHGHAHADTMALAGMSVHNFADGLTTAAAFAVSKPVGVVVFVAILLHQMAAGLSLGAIMTRAGRNRRRVLVSTSVTAAFIVFGALFYHFVIPVNESATGIVLGIAGGSFLYVAACDLLPEAHVEDRGWSVMAMTVAGYAFALLIGMFGAPHAH